MDRSAFPLGQAPVYFYEIDVEDRIVAASDSWDEFALENEGAHLVFANVKGDLIWDHISDAETADLYRRIFSAARRGKPVRFFLRCDSPSVRRMLSVNVAQNEVGDLRISTMQFRADKREPYGLRSSASDSEGIDLPVCSWCEKVKVSENDWQEVEGAAEILQRDGTPVECRVSYTVCPACRQQIERQIVLAGK